MQCLDPLFIGDLSRTFSARLRLCLDRMGFPGNMRDKCRELAFRLGVDEGCAAALLMGAEMPDYDLLLMVCRMTQQRPGYFLDPELACFPTGTRLVRCIGVGEELAISLPQEMAAKLPTRPFETSYLRASRDMGFGVKASDYIFAFEVPMEPAAIKKDNLYLIGCETGFDLRRCVVQTPVRAAFTSYDGRSAHTIKPCMAAVGTKHKGFLAEGMGEEISVFSEVIGILRSERNMNRHGI